jgi:hypothetical protein
MRRGASSEKSQPRRTVLSQQAQGDVVVSYPSFTPGGIVVLACGCVIVRAVKKVRRLLETASHMNEGKEPLIPGTVKLPHLINKKMSMRIRRVAGLV